jgi:hypothetical protein
MSYKDKLFFLLDEWCSSKDKLSYKRIEVYFIQEFLEDLKNPSIHTFKYLIRKWEEKLKK